MNNKLNDAILEAFEAYATAKDYVKGWQKEATRRRSVVLALINAAKKTDPEIREVSTRDLFNRTVEMYEAAHAPAEDQEAEDQQAPAEDQQAPADTEEEQAPADDEPDAD